MGQYFSRFVKTPDILGVQLGQLRSDPFLLLRPVQVMDQQFIRFPFSRYNFRRLP